MNAVETLLHRKFQKLKLHLDCAQPDLLDEFTKLTKLSRQKRYQSKGEYYFCRMQNTQDRPHFEFIALMASLMSIVALSIDTLLPAIPNIGATIGSPDPTDNQLLITMIFLGLGIGQLILGPLSDQYGRKPVVYVGFLIFGAGSVVCLVAKSLEVMLVGRVLQGIGLSAHRTIAISIIRDSYYGDRMARVMSFVTAFFILVPMVAPTLGKWILDLSNWQMIFYVHLFLAVVLAVWFWKRQKETLRPEYKVPFSLNNFVSGLREMSRYRETVAFTFISGLITGSFLVYLSSVQHIFENQYHMRESFPYLFAILSISIGASTFTNGTLVLRFGMRKLSFVATLVFSTIALVYVLLFWDRPNPDVWFLVGFFFLQFFCLGFMWGNFRSIAMAPVGHIAGIGAAINGFVSTLISIPIASFIGQFVVDTAWPIFAGLSVCGFLSVLIFVVLRKGQRSMLSMQ